MRLMFWSISSLQNMFMRQTKWYFIKQQLKKSSDNNKKWLKEKKQITDAKQMTKNNVFIMRKKKKNRVVYLLLIHVSFRWHNTIFFFFTFWKRILDSTCALFFLVFLFVFTSNMYPLIIRSDFGRGKYSISKNFQPTIYITSSNWFLWTANESPYCLHKMLNFNKRKKQRKKKKIEPINRNQIK